MSFKEWWPLEKYRAKYSIDHPIYNMAMDAWNAALAEVNDIRCENCGRILGNDQSCGECRAATQALTRYDAIQSAPQGGKELR